MDRVEGTDRACEAECAGTSSAGLSGLVCNIQRFSVHDGPGIRTTVFLKGCTLRCFWCHNPESIGRGLELQLHPDRCIGCDECSRVCPTGAQEVTADGERVYHRELCIACGACVEVCYAGARELTGREMTVDAVVHEILQDSPFYENSGGGVTLSGGEPVYQPEFSLEVLQRCRDAGIHTAIETAGNVPWEKLALLMPVTDLVAISRYDWMQFKTATLVNINRMVVSTVREYAPDTLVAMQVELEPGENAVLKPNVTVGENYADPDTGITTHPGFVQGAIEHLQAAIQAEPDNPDHRLHLARALAQEPRVLLLDEPTSHLDLANVRRILGVLRSLRADGRTIVLTTHDPNAAAAIADDVLLMRGGQVIAAGPTGSVMDSERLSATYGVTVEVVEVRGRPLVLSHDLDGAPDRGA